MTRRAAVITMIAACTLALAGPAAKASAAGTRSRSTVHRVTGSGQLRFSSRRAGAGERSMIAQATAAAASTGAALYEVSCTARARCTATGLVTTRTGKNARTLAERWNGTKRAAQATPTPPSGGLPGGLFSAGVSCTSSPACVTIATPTARPRPSCSPRGGTAGSPLVEVWNGSTWTEQSAPR